MASIIIEKGDPATGKLTLNPPILTWADKKETILWKIDNHSGVQSISNILVKPSPPSNVIFSEPPQPVGGSDNWKAKIDRSSPNFSVYLYSIYWIPTSGTDPDPSNPVKKHDPIIAVKPSLLNLRHIILLLLGLFGVSALTLYLNSKIGKKH